MVVTDNLYSSFFGILHSTLVIDDRYQQWVPAIRNTAISPWCDKFDVQRMMAGCKRAIVMGRSLKDALWGSVARLEYLLQSLQQVVAYLLF